jgi:hypothetical protein
MFDEAINLFAACRSGNRFSSRSDRFVSCVFFTLPQAGAEDASSLSSSSRTSFPSSAPVFIEGAAISSSALHPAAFSSSFSFFFSGFFSVALATLLRLDAFTLIV